MPFVVLDTDTTSQYRKVGCPILSPIWYAATSSTSAS
jgi:hypothetical protein